MASLKALKPFLLPAIAVALIVNANISKDAEREEVYKNSSLASKACTKEKQRRQEKLNSSRRWEGKFKCTYNNSEEAWLLSENKSKIEFFGKISSSSWWRCLKKWKRLKESDSDPSGLYKNLKCVVAGYYISGVKYYNAPDDKKVNDVYLLYNNKINRVIKRFEIMRR